MSIRKPIIAILFTLLLFPLFALGIDHSYATEVKVTINKKAISFPDQRPFITQEGRTLVPVRFVSEELGATVEWVESTRDVIIKKGSDTVTMRVNSKAVTKNGSLSSMDVAPTITNGRTMVPLRFVSEQLGVGVRWEASTYTVVIYTDLRPGNLVTLPSDADDIDRKIQALALENSSWGNLWYGDRDVSKSYLTNLGTIKQNLNSDEWLGAVYLQRSTNLGDVSVITKYEQGKTKCDLIIMQNDLTQLSYDGVWAALTSLFSEEDATKVWKSHIQYIKNCHNNDIWTPISGTITGYKYTSFLYSNTHAISFDRI